MDQNDYPGTPAWVRWLVIALAVALATFIGLHLTGMAPMGSHGS